MNSVSNPTKNPGIVPPWLTQPAPPSGNPGIVPPWLTQPAPPSGNPGIVPPWLVDAPRILPVTPNEATATTFARESTSVSSPKTFVDAIRSR